MIKNVIFDLDGVIRGIKNTPILEILPDGLRQKYRLQYQNEGLCDFVARYLPLPIFKDWDKGFVSANDVLNEIVKQTQEPRDAVTEVFYAALKPEHNFVYGQTVELIKNLKNEGCRVFILSNMCEEVVAILPQFLDLEMFDDVAFSCEFGLRKPDKAFYAKALEKFGTTASTCIFIDDNLKNLQPFEELGGKTFLFDNSKLSDTISRLEQKIKKQ